MSIAMDGTAQFDNGLPRFKEVTKKDAAGNRFAVHTQIAVVHAPGTDRVKAFVVWEDIAGNPNWTCHTLDQVLKQEEEIREEWPEVLYLQTDNCFRENKNTYLMNYCCWLVERDVFKQVFVSFLPTGHTHFDPDQVASRISEAVSARDVTSLDDYMDVVTTCYHPNIEVSAVEDVIDIKALLNPANADNFPTATARCHRTLGIGVKSVQPMREWFMAATSPLHWRMRRDIDRKVFVQAKFTVDDIAWGEAHYPWTNAPRPGKRVFEADTSGLIVEDLTYAPNKPLIATRAAELEVSLKDVKHRLSTDDWTKLQAALTRVTTPRHTTAVGVLGELKGMDMTEEEDFKDEDAVLTIRPHNLFASAAHASHARELRKTQGHASKPLVVGNFVAYVVDYEDGMAAEKCQDFFLGKITQIDIASSQVEYGNITPQPSKTCNLRWQSTSSTPKILARTGCLSVKCWKHSKVCRRKENQFHRQHAHKDRLCVAVVLNKCK
jgi:hypothetical protein